MHAVFRISLAIANSWIAYFRNAMDTEKILSSAERRALIESLPAMRPKPPETDRSSVAQWNRRYQEFDQLIGMTLDAIAANLSMEGEALQSALVALVDKHKAETQSVSTDRRRTLDPAWQMAERAVEMVRTGGATQTDEARAELN
jgi:hypothetical protein